MCKTKNLLNKKFLNKQSIGTTSKWPVITYWMLVLFIAWVLWNGISEQNIPVHLKYIKIFLNAYTVIANSNNEFNFIILSMGLKN